MTTKKKDINERNREFWERVQEQVKPLLEDPELLSEVIASQAQTATRWGGVKGLNSLEADLLSEHAVRTDRRNLEERATLGDKGKQTLEQQRKNQRKAVAEVTKYGPEDKAAWRKIAEGEDLRGKSKLQKARVIAHRLGLPLEAISTIRRVVD
ncbi:hypothetical protein VSR69_33100 [Paraburkholderia phytofirmans]|uniref:hypothetical protein n=1 Tax=Paraburkholderia sp. BL9I2N2 TaxID=1938809 RepID=UPI00104AC7A7|nr:hypothetical protein [Paraburkholderia sp. BL9I2N2]TCK96000.1 hypothetical protein B0G74_2643 [Paraburkholderia sp. BL9I2N2]